MIYQLAGIKFNALHGGKLFGVVEADDKTRKKRTWLNLPPAISGMWEFPESSNSVSVRPGLDSSTSAKSLLQTINVSDFSPR
jgi:hypothetical protein